MAAAKKPRKFTVTRVDEYTLDYGEFPPPVVAKLIEDAAGQWIPTLFLGDTDFSLGEGGEYGGASNISVEVNFD